MKYESKSTIMCIAAIFAVAAIAAIALVVWNVRTRKATTPPAPPTAQNAAVIRSLATACGGGCGTDSEATTG